MTDEAGKTLQETESVCPDCLKRIPAQLVARGEDVVMEKRCAEHGEFRTPVWRGLPSFDGWRRTKAVARVAANYSEERRGCPFDCGICPNHRQIGCTGLLEITGRCNLDCPVCFADSGSRPAADPSLGKIGEWYRRVMEVNGPCSIQLSGGEPTMRDDLPEIIRLGRDSGFSFIQLNSNGIRLAAEKGYARTLKQAGLVSLFLQFDGSEDAIYEKLRGRALLKEKYLAIENCIASGIGVVLVPTIVAGVNSRNLGEIIRTALQLGPGLRGVHFQPAARFGRYPTGLGSAGRLTLPELMTALEQQTGGLVTSADFQPPGCEHERCSFHGSFIRLPGGTLRPVSTPRSKGCCGQAEDPREDVRRTVALVARQWAAPARPLQPDGASATSALPLVEGAPFSLDQFLEQAVDNSFTISGMAFQDAWNLDLERLKNCCIHVVAPDGRLIPFCAYNLTAANGAGLYRGGC
jgi:hypothetical protein